MGQAHISRQPGHHHTVLWQRRKQSRNGKTGVSQGLQDCAFAFTQIGRVFFPAFGIKNTSLRLAASPYRQR